MDIMLSGGALWLMVVNVKENEEDVPFQSCDEGDER